MRSLSKPTKRRNVAERHGIDDRADVLEKLSKALDNLTDAAVSPE